MRLGQQIEKDFEENKTTLRMSNDFAVHIQTEAERLHNEMKTFISSAHTAGLDTTLLRYTFGFLAQVHNMFDTKVIQLAEPSPDGTTRSDNERIRILESQVEDLNKDLTELVATIARRLPPPIPVAGIKGGYKY